MTAVVICVSQCSLFSGLRQWISTSGHYSNLQCFRSQFRVQPPACLVTAINLAVPLQQNVSFIRSAAPVFIINLTQSTTPLSGVVCLPSLCEVAWISHDTGKCLSAFAITIRRTMANIMRGREILTADLMRIQVLEDVTPCIVIVIDVSGGARGGAVGWGTEVQAGRSRVRFPTVSLEFFIDIILPPALWPWGWLNL